MLLFVSLLLCFFVFTHEWVNAVMVVCVCAQARYKNKFYCSDSLRPDSRLKDSCLKTFVFTT